MRATGIKLSTGFLPAGNAAQGRYARSLPTPFTAPSPSPNPVPGFPIPPSKHASTTIIQIGCSPFCWRVRDQLAFRKVGLVTIFRAKETIRSASSSTIGAAQFADFGWPSVSPIKYGRNCSKPTQLRARNSRSCKSSLTSVWAIASIKATSVFGRMGIHSAFSSSFTSD